MRISHVVGTRPNIVKLAALYPHLPGTVYHTGQHSGSMSDPFFREFDLPSPKPLRELSGDLAVVFGDCRATLEGSLAAKGLGMRLAHVEAGLRCGDMDMEEERIRIAVDQISDFLFCPSQDAVDNLKAEGVKGQIHLVGNVVIDTLMPHRYGLLTLHRPFNVDGPVKLKQILAAVSGAGLRFDWPVHPRVQDCGNWANIDPMPPLDRISFTGLLMGASVVVTDSGGVQEEAAFFGVPCITVRPSTERPITLQYGNTLCTDISKLTDMILDEIPCLPYWDGRASERIAKILLA